MGGGCDGAGVRDWEAYHDGTVVLYRGRHERMIYGGHEDASVDSLLKVARWHFVKVTTAE